MKSDDISELAAALSAAQSEFNSVPLNSINPFLKSRYADLGAMIVAAKPVLNRHGLAISQLMISDGPNVGIQTMLMHKSGQYLSSAITIFAGDEKGKSYAQVVGSTITYLRRYAYSAILGLHTDDDADGNAPKPGRQAEPESSAPPLKPRPTWKPSPDMRGRWDKIAAEARALGIEMDFDMMTSASASEIPGRVQAIKAAIAAKQGATK